MAHTVLGGGKGGSGSANLQCSFRYLYRAVTRRGNLEICQETLIHLIHLVHVFGAQELGRLQQVHRCPIRAILL